MCKHEVLSQNKNGYIIRCKQCSNFQIGFGTSAITFSPEQFEIFKEEVILQMRKNKLIEDINQKTIILPTFSKSVSFVLNFRELAKLMELMEEADYMHNIKELFNPGFFSNK
jgi:hypothetical protein